MKSETKSSNNSLINFVEIVANVISIVFTLLLLADSFANNQTSLIILPRPAISFFCVVVAMLVLLRLRTELKLFPWFNNLLSYLLLPSTVVLTITTSIVDFYTPINQVFVWTRLHQNGLGIAAIFMTVVWLVAKSDNWWRKNYSLVISLIPVVGFVTLMIIRTWPFNFFLEFIEEDHFIEYTQFFVLLLGSMWLAYYSWLAKNKNRKLASIFCLLMALSLFFVAGDEISWGQRILGIETPESIAQHNQQGETTLHNMELVGWMVGWGYLIISWLGILSRPMVIVLSKIHTKVLRLYKYTADSKLAGYFIFPAIFHLVNFLQGFGIWPEWAEPMELFIYSGIVVWMWQIAHLLTHDEYLWSSLKRTKK